MHYLERTILKALGEIEVPCSLNRYNTMVHYLLMRHFLDLNYLATFFFCNANQLFFVFSKVCTFIILTFLIFQGLDIDW